MNPITHLLLGWPIATLRGELRDQRWIVGAGLAADVDGLGLVAEIATRNGGHPLLWWSQYHHVLAHNLTFGLVVAGVAGVTTRRAAVAGLGFLSFHLHLVGDLVGSRGPDGAQWPLPYLLPFSRSAELIVPWQWQLDAWPNVVVSLLLLAWALWFAWKTGRSPLGLVSARANDALVAALRSRFRLGGRHDR